MVRRGTPATIVFPNSQRPKLKLDYSRKHPPAYRTTLGGCKRRRAGFVGGFKVMGPICTELRVRVEGRSRTITKPVSFGAGSARPNVRAGDDLFPVWGKNPSVGG